MVAGMLSTARLQRGIGRVLARMYEPAVLEIWETSQTRNTTTGTFPRVKVRDVRVRVQRDACSEAQQRQADYTAGDVRFLILQTGVRDAPNTDCELVYRGERYMLCAPIEQDPARVYWDARARLKKTG